MAILGGRLTKTDLQKLRPQRIIDLGTGFGHWAIAVAEQECPEATVIGNDLSAVQPEEVPGNCHFIVDDFLSEWIGGPYDFVHGRALMGTVPDWPDFYATVYENLTPGGILEMQELNAWISCQGVTPPHIQAWNEVLNDAFDRFGKPLNVAGQHAQWMRDAGFVDVEDIAYHVPIGLWPRDRGMKDIGRAHMVAAMESVDSYSMSIMTEHMRQTPEQTEVQITLIRQEFRQKHQLYGTYHFITGRKPAQ